jgi:hypothetical protein
MEEYERLERDLEKLYGIYLVFWDWSWGFNRYYLLEL